MVGRNFVEVWEFALSVDMSGFSCLLCVTSRTYHKWMKSQYKMTFICVQTLTPQNSATGTRTRVARVRAEYPNQLDYSGVDVDPLMNDHMH